MIQGPQIENTLVKLNSLKSLAFNLYSTGQFSAKSRKTCIYRFSPQNGDH